MRDLLTMLEIIRDQQELREWGLSEEEVEGYLEFFIDNYKLTNVDNDRRKRCLSVNTSAKNAETFRRNG